MRGQRRICYERDFSCMNKICLHFEDVLYNFILNRIAWNLLYLFLIDIRKKNRVTNIFLMLLCAKVEQPNVLFYSLNHVFPSKIFVLSTISLYNVRFLQQRDLKLSVSIPPTERFKTVRVYSSNRKI